MRPLRRGCRLRPSFRCCSWLGLLRHGSISLRLSCCSHCHRRRHGCFKLCSYPCRSQLGLRWHCCCRLRRHSHFKLRLRRLRGRHYSGPRCRGSRPPCGACRRHGSTTSSCCSTAISLLAPLGGRSCWPICGCRRQQTAACRRQQRHHRLPRCHSVVAEPLEVSLRQVSVGGGATLAFPTPQLPACSSWGRRVARVEEGQVRPVAGEPGRVGGGCWFVAAPGAPSSAPDPSAVPSQPFHPTPTAPTHLHPSWAAAAPEPDAPAVLPLPL